MNPKRRIVIAEDHTLLRAGLKALLAQEAGVDVVDAAESGAAGDLANSGEPDLVLMDIAMPGTNGVDAIADVKRRSPNAKVLVMTSHRTEAHVQAALRAGADGYILKNAPHDELRVAVRSLLDGKSYLSPDVSGRVISGYLSGGKPEPGAAAWERLTPREREVLKLVAEGYGNKHIASHLRLSVKTVEKHRANLMKKLDLHNASLLTAYAIENGLVTR